MRRIKVLAHPLIFLLTAFIIIAGCSSDDHSDKTVVATWDNNSFTAEALRDSLIFFYGSIENAKRQTLKSRFDNLNMNLDKQIWLEEARRRGIDKRTSILLCCEEKIHTLQLKEEETRDKESAELVFQMYIRDRVITEDKIKGFWEKDQFEMRAKHLLVYIPPEITGDDTLQYWQKMQRINKLVKSGSDFTGLVKKYSDDKPKGKPHDGDLGYFRWGRMVDEFQDAVWALNVGEISEPVRSEFGYHIIKLIDKRPLNKQFDTSHILISCSNRADAAERTLANDRAEMVFEKAKEKGSDFVELARAYSEDRGTWVNGRIGFNPRGKMHENYWEACQTMEKGDVTGPISSDQGYHIIKLHDIKKEEVSLDDHTERERIIAMLMEFHAEELSNASKTFSDSVLNANGLKYSQAGFNLLLNGVNSPELLDNQDLDRFSFFTEQELNTKVVEDKSKSVLIGDLANKYKEYGLPVGKISEERLKGEIIEPLFWDSYVKDLIKIHDIHNHPVVVEAVRLSSEHIVLLELEYELLLENVHPTEKEIDEYYKKHILRDKIPELVESLDEKREEIIKNIRYDQLDEVKANELKKLKKEFNLKINKKAIEEIWPLIEPLPQVSIDERLAAVKERRRIGKEAKQKRKEASEIQMQLKPGSTQTFLRDGKEIKVKIGEPRPADKEKLSGKSTSRVKQSKPGQKKVIELMPKKTGN